MLPRVNDFSARIPVAVASVRRLLVSVGEMLRSGVSLTLSRELYQLQSETTQGDPVVVNVEFDSRICGFCADVISVQSACMSEDLDQ